MGSKTHPSCSPTRRRRRYSQIMKVLDVDSSTPWANTSSRWSSDTPSRRVNGYGGYKVLAKQGNRAARLLLEPRELQLLWDRHAPARPLWPLTRIAGPAGSRKRSVVAPPRSGARFARAQPASARSSRTLAARQARAYQPKDQARRGDSLRVVALGRTVPVPRQRPRSTSTVVARTIRPRALTRKNALFADSDGGAEHWAVIAALIEICRLIGVEPSTTWPTSHPHRRWSSQ